MRMVVLPPHAVVRANLPLVARGGLVRTFGSLAIFLALILLFSGIYLLVEVFENPLTAEGAGLIVGAFTIVLSTEMFYFIVKPQKNRSPNGKQ